MLSSILTFIVILTEFNDVSLSINKLIHANMFRILIYSLQNYIRILQL